jgi:hypothetical protein
MLEPTTQICVLSAGCEKAWRPGGIGVSSMPSRPRWPTAVQGKMPGTVAANEASTHEAPDFARWSDSGNRTVTVVPAPVYC